MSSILWASTLGFKCFKFVIVSDLEMTGSDATSTCHFAKRSDGNLLDISAGSESIKLLQSKLVAKYCCNNISSQHLKSLTVFNRLP